ncbi:MAG: electron transport complex subunit RsxC [Kiritimatiellia bacterium]|jgi:electron transport complex protein RnfC
MKVLKSPRMFRGGVHPPEKKDLSSQPPIVALPVPAVLKVPLVQHLGAPAKAVVEVGATVKRGDMIGVAQGFVSSPVHAPTSGVVKGFEMRPGAVGRLVQHCVIEADGLDARSEVLQPLPDWAARSTQELIDRIAEAGIVGMGGAGFPTHVKVAPPPDKPIHTLIVNGAECEPYLTSDHRTMLERTADIWEGIRIQRQILGAKQVWICIEENKPDAIEAFSKVESDDDVGVVVLKTFYPHGSEKQQIWATLGVEVPSGGLPADVGCLVENVGTLVAIQEAVVKGWPLDSRCVTVTGECIRNPGNFHVRCGMAYADLIAAAGGCRTPPHKLVSGGPMMGFAVANADVVVTKTTSGIVALDASHAAAYSSMPCISCGRCNHVCPMRLLPSEMSCAIEADDIDQAIDLHVADCYECGCCSYVCPSHRPLVQHFRRAKGELAARRAKARAEAQAKAKAEESKS